VVAGAGFLIVNTAATTRLQLEIDDEQRGRIMALWAVAFIGCRPIASLVDGLLAEAAGVRVSTLAFACAPLAAAAVFGALAVRRARARA
jgi:hypothetical protein